MGGKVAVTVDVATGSWAVEVRACVTCSATMIQTTDSQHQVGTDSTQYPTFPTTPTTPRTSSRTLSARIRKYDFLRGRMVSVTARAEGHMVLMMRLPQGTQREKRAQTAFRTSERTLRP